jgi:hypothetical protein
MMATEIQNSGIPATNSWVPSRGSNDPDPTFVQTGEIIDALFGKLTFSLPQQLLTKHIVNQPYASGTGSCPNLYSAAIAPRLKRLSVGASGFGLCLDALEDLRL